MEIITLIIPAYNEENKIKKCLSSVLDQVLEKEVKLNVIIVANACDDNTACVAIKFITDNHIDNWHVLSIKTRGKCNALNMALSQVDIRSKYIGYMDADCELEKNAVFYTYSAFKNNHDLKLVGALDLPMIASKETLLSKCQLVNQIHREARGRIIPVGRFCVFIQGLVCKFPLKIHSEDTWLALTTAQKYGWQSVRVLDEAKVYFTAPKNWLDYIKQESRFEVGYLQLVRSFPKLKEIWEQRRHGFKKQKSKYEIDRILVARLEQEGIKSKEIVALSDALAEIIEDNANIMVDELINYKGFWDPIASTKA